MKRGIVFIGATAIAAAFLFYFFGEGSGSFFPDRERSSIPEYHDPAQPIEIAAGREFMIALERGPGSSSAWQLAGTLDKELIRLVEVKHTATKTRKSGMKVRNLWTFQGLREGETAVFFETVNTEAAEGALREQKRFSVLFHEPEPPGK